MDYEVIYFESIDSTNAFAIENAANKTLREDVNNLIIANHQTAGKGRMGRSFESGENDGIFMTLVIRPQKKSSEIANITLVAAVAVSRALEEITGLKAKVKWPNDIIVNGKKICGILTEMKNDGSNVRFVALGIGINVNNRSFTDKLKAKATSVYIETGKRFSRQDILVKVISRFEELYKIYLANSDLAFIQEEYNEKLINIGSKIIVEQEMKVWRQSAWN